MIDVHCHLEQKDYDKDRDKVIEKCKKELKAIITSCAHPKDFELTMRMAEKHKNFVFASCGLHPEYIKDVSENETDEYLEKIVENRNKIVAMGETGLDFWWTKEEEWRKKQKELFVKLIEFAKDMGKPLVVHSRDVYDETVRILENEDARKVMLHMWGERNLINRIIENGWYVSMNTIILRSKGYRKVIKKLPLERLMLETDAPWLSPKKLLEGVETRNDPTSIRLVAEKIAELKNASFEEIWQKCGENAVKFFNLTV